MSSLWPYHFISLSESDKLNRRDLLDLRGHYAQLSIVLAIIAVRVFRSLATASGKTSKSARGLPSWWDRPLVPGWIETRRQYFICGLWLLWLLSLSVWNSGEGMVQNMLDENDEESATDISCRLSSFNQSIGSCRPVPNTFTGLDVPSGVYFNYQARSVIVMLGFDRYLSANFDTVSPSLWPSCCLASPLGPCHAVHGLFRAKQSSGVRSLSLQTSS
jgi:hypothetical protein